MDIIESIRSIGQAARQASRMIARASSAEKNKALMMIAQHLSEAMPRLLEANQKDLEKAKAAGLDAAMLDRLRLSEKSIATMAEGLRQIAALPDPVGEITDLARRPSGISVGKMRVPLGVIGIIYEARPNVTADAAALCIKSGNAAVLRGGKEAFYSNQAISDCVRAGLTACGLPETIVQVVSTTDRAAVGALISMPEYIDVIVPRGGKGLIERISKEARVPVIKHLDGNCHVYIDDSANPAYILPIVENAKTQRYGTCNTTETLLIARSLAARQLPIIGKMLTDKGVELRACPESLALLQSAHLPANQLKAACEQDWYEEFLAPILAIKIVGDLDEAIEHINTYSSAHTESIITENYTHAMRFLREVDSSSVMVNTSTRFADGFEYGLGAEIGISTDKIHARGPVGLEGLTSQKWVVLGQGEIRA